MLAKRGVNGWNLFQKNMFAQQPDLLRLEAAARHAAVKQAWQAADKDTWSQMAKASNLEVFGAMSQTSARTPASEHPGGPWGIGSSTGFPLARHVIDNTCNQVQKNSQKFHTEHNALQPEAADSLNGAPPEAHPLFLTCTVNGCGCHRCMPEASKPTMERLYNSFWKLVLHRAPRATVSAQAQEPLLVSFASQQTGESLALAVAFHTLRAPLQAAVLLLHPERPSELVEHGIEMSFHCCSPSNPQAGLQLESESVALARLARAASDWEMKLLDVGPVRLLGRFDIVGSRPAPNVESKEPEAAMDEDSQAAMAAFDLLQPPRKKHKPQPRAGHSVSKPVSKKAK